MDLAKGVAATAATVLVLLVALKFGADNVDFVKKVRDYALG